MMRRFSVHILAICAILVVAEKTSVNPIRKVVTMLQHIQHGVEEEGSRAEVMFNKFLCYCGTSGDSLKASIDGAEAKISEVLKSIEEAEAKETQLASDLNKHSSDREAAKQAIAEADAIRNKEAKAFAAMKSESETNIVAIGKAVTALEKGAGGFFLQSASAVTIRNLVQSRDIRDSDREELMSFFEAKQGSSYSPASGAVTGILKQMGDELGADLADATKQENESVDAHAALVAAKKKEIAANSAAIEDKTARQGDLKVRITEMKNDVSDTKAALEADKTFLADLQTKCSTAQTDYDEAKKIRTQELLALAETIKLLNSDDALELFKKALPGSANLLQVQTVSKTRSNALRLLDIAHDPHSMGFDFISLALQGEKGSFDKVIGMIDNMVGVLKQEQADDKSKKEYCSGKLENLDDAKKGTERAISVSETAVAEAQDLLKTLAAEIEALEAGIGALDKSVEDARVQRKNEHSAYTELIAGDTAAKKLLGMAKNRLAKFYNPALHVAEPALVAVALHQQVAPPPAPELPHVYGKKAEESNGVVALLDALVADLDKEMTIASTEEKNAQADYEKTLKDAAAKRADDTQTLNDKKGTHADTAAALRDHTDELTSRKGELVATLEVIQGLHGECDWLLKYFDVRKEARAQEVDSLVKAKAVLRGADYA